MPATHDLDGKHFFTKKGGVWHATPLLIALVFLEMTDIVFAVDSVPAIFGVTKEAFIVFTSNIFAILGLAVDVFYAGWGDQAVLSAPFWPGICIGLRRAKNGVAQRPLRREISDHVVAGNNSGCNCDICRAVDI